MVEFESPVDESSESGRCSAWLGMLAHTRDLTLPLADVSAATYPPARDAQRFVHGLCSELLEFRAIVDAATSVAELNATQLTSLVENTKNQQNVVESAAAAVAEVDRGAANVAQTAEALRTVTATMGASTTGYERGIARVLDALHGLRATIQESAASAVAAHTSSDGIVAFLDRLRRIARQARLLAINAAIEAAHLGDLGRGFEIVADQIKALASSTADSAQNVARIHTELNASSVRVDAAIHESADVVAALEDTLAVAHAGSVAAGELVRDIDDTIGDVAAIAAEQSASLSAISSGVELLAKHAQDVAAAAERAGALAIGDSIAELKRAVGMYRLDERPSGEAACTVEALPEALRASAQHLRSRVDADQREMLAAIMAVAVAIARNSFEWKAIAVGLAALQEQLTQTTNAIDETAAGADLAGAASKRLRAALDAISARLGSSVDELQNALERVSHIHDAVRDSEAAIDITAGAADRAAAILDLIDTISSETTLLSFNAAIEAAHAGDAGASFGIIANEIRLLAQGTSESTRQIAAVIDDVAGTSRSMRASSAAARDHTTGVQTETADVKVMILGVRTELETTVERASEVASIVDQQLTALASVRSAADIAASQVRSDSAAATDSRRIELAMLGMRAHAFAARRPLGIIAESIRAIGLRVADAMDGVFDTAIARGTIALDDCYDTAYVPIVGAKIAELGRLFDVARVPAAGFNPPKFATRYDRAVEDGIDAIIDAAVPEHAAIKAMFAVDLNGYCFGHYRQCRQAWTGDYSTDLNNNRIKRFFDDELSLRCSRVGLGAASDVLPKRTDYHTFRERGCTLAQTDPRPWAIFTYARDTGIVYNDLSVGLFAKGTRVGTIRIIYDADVV